MPPIDARRVARTALALLTALLPFTAPPHALAADAADPPEWLEGAVPLPPAFQAARALPLDMPLYTSLRYAVDPATLALGPDGVVRYVMVVTSPDGTVTGLYEGLRCATAEYKTYARHNAGQWAPVANAAWQSLFSMQRHALALAQQAACTGAAPASTVADMVRALRTGQRPN